MPRWTGTWLEGPGVTLGELRDPSTWQGSRLGLPKQGRGAIAPFGVRAFAFFVDILVCSLVAGLINVLVENPTGVQRQAAGFGVLLVEHVLLVALSGQTVGMRLMGLKVLWFKDPMRVPGFVPALIRTVPLLLTLGLSGFFTREGRGLHDLAAGTAVVRG